MKVLLVEDDAVNMNLLVELMRKWGHESHIAKNGLQAIIKVGREDYDLILMDLFMPIMGGLDATEIIRKEWQRTTPIIAVTAASFITDKAMCYAAGINEFISKPFDAQKLQALVNEWGVKKVDLIAN
ncbi:MAG: CheY-like chemotaxis protein [Candidatus Omnitrophota bacterium]|jgi:CheY-like chemotaxis protein